MEFEKEILDGFKIELKYIRNKDENNFSIGS